MTEHFKNLRAQLIDIQNKHGAPGHNAISEITSDIFITNIENLASVSTIQDYGISVLICLVDVPIPKKYMKAKFIILKLEHVDDEREQILPTLYRLYDEIYSHLSAGRKIVVCCRTGTSLSPAIVASYLLRRQYLLRISQCYNIQKSKTRKKSILELASTGSELPMIFKFILQSRKCMKINPGFIMALIVYETKIKQSIHDNISILSATRNEIAPVPKQVKTVAPTPAPRYDTLADVRRFDISSL